MAQAAAAPPADDLVPVQLALNGTREGAVQEWVLWPPAATDADLSDFTESLVGDLGLQPELKQPVTEAIVAQVTDWCNSVRPPARGPAPRRELIRLDLVLDGSLRLRDQFWWDLHSDTLTPEEFAAELCADSGVDARHGAAVAAAIRIELAKLRQAPPTNLPLPTPRIVEGKPADNGKQEAQLQSVYASRSAARLLASHAAGLVSTVAALL
ncbi:hypothetical protein COHA_000132 [Chlorella ohadii]|uniref:Uncharacterized protein n=1 Tax=Chlorella ohadii TaxID=2649997 RepID=A0AAD5DXR7_9CHLO|nr:hypothetical protein COHA_000132 [Chlorella ohadii]